MLSYIKQPFRDILLFNASTQKPYCKLINDEKLWSRYSVSTTTPCRFMGLIYLTVKGQEHRKCFVFPLNSSMTTYCWRGYCWSAACKWWPHSHPSSSHTVCPDSENWEQMERQTETEAQTTEVYSKCFFIYNCCNIWFIMYVHICPVPMADYYFSF